MVTSLSELEKLVFVLALCVTRATKIGRKMEDWYLWKREEIPEHKRAALMEAPEGASLKDK